jgi:hypothetical protein
MKIISCLILILGIACTAHARDPFDTFMSLNYQQCARTSGESICLARELDQQNKALAVLRQNIINHCGGRQQCIASFENYRMAMDQDLIALQQLMQATSPNTNSITLKKAAVIMTMRRIELLGALFPRR